MSAAQMLRWEILNDKCKQHPSKEKYFLNYIIDSISFHYEMESINWESHWKNEREFFIVEKSKYSSLIGNGEIVLCNTTNTPYEGIEEHVEATRSHDPLEDYPDIDEDYCLCFSYDEEKIHKAFNNEVGKWKLDTGIGNKSYKKQKEIILESIEKQRESLGDKPSYEIRNQIKSIDVQQCLFAMEQDKLIAIKKFTPHGVIVSFSKKEAAKKPVLTKGSQQKNIIKEHLGITVYSDSSIKIENKILTPENATPEEKNAIVALKCLMGETINRIPREKFLERFKENKVGIMNHRKTKNPNQLVTKILSHTRKILQKNSSRAEITTHSSNIYLSEKS